ncbi:hypothetical protein C4K40_3804 [Pseudomonas sp. CMR5c]|nr:hypothetical protein C4K40_3804 [Pseudomonas sp. CMR5c]
MVHKWVLVRWMPAVRAGVGKGYASGPVPARGDFARLCCNDSSWGNLE